MDARLILLSVKFANALIECFDAIFPGITIALASKPMAVICHAPWLLVSADVVRGRRLTSYYTIQDDIRNAGGEWLDQEVVEDGNLVTSRQPSDLPALNQAMLTLFACMPAEQRGGRRD